MLKAGPTTWVSNSLSRRDGGLGDWDGDGGGRGVGRKESK